MWVNCWTDARDGVKEERERGPICIPTSTLHLKTHPLSSERNGGSAFIGHEDATQAASEGNSYFTYFALLPTLGRLGDHLGNQFGKYLQKSDRLCLSHRETGRHDEEDNAIDDDSTVDSLVR